METFADKLCLESYRRCARVVFADHDNLFASAEQVIANIANQQLDLSHVGMYACVSIAILVPTMSSHTVILGFISHSPFQSFDVRLVASRYPLGGSSQVNFSIG